VPNGTIFSIRPSLVQGDSSLIQMKSLGSQMVMS